VPVVNQCKRYARRIFRFKRSENIKLNIGIFLF
jgi:hypothetical protein